MLREIVLFRHGIAEDHGIKPDFDRALTEAGIQKTQKAARGLASLIGDREVTLLSSPLVRAVQTAEIIGNILHLDIAERSWISDGSLYDLKKEIADSDTLLLIVGHQPTFSVWHYALTGEWYEYKKAGAARLAFPEGEEKGRCVWAYKAKELVAIGERKQDEEN